MSEPKDKTQTIGWMISEIYPMVRKIYRHLGVDGEPAKPVNEQVAYLEGQLQTCREQLAATTPITNGPNLGMASTEEMFRELIARFKHVSEANINLNIERALVLAEMLGNMDAATKEYRTVDDG